MAHAAIYFERRMQKEGPSYANCPTDCTRPERDQKNGCPRCEYTIQWALFKQACQRRLDEKSSGPKANAEWPLNLLLNLLNDVYDADASVRGKGFGRTWSVVTERLVRIYRDEIAKARAIDVWNLRKDADGEDDEDDELARVRRNKANKLKSLVKSRVTDDEDDGDYD